MRTIGRLVVVIALFAGVRAYAQPATKLNQNFDVQCVLSTDFPSGWLRYNPIQTTIPLGAWSCTPEGGRDTTPGLQCTGYYDKAFHLDTAYLICPLLNFSGYGTSSVFFRFDTKVSIPSGSSLSVFTSYTDIFSAADTGIAGIYPPMGSPADTNWTTREVDISGYKGNTDFFLGFRYTSTDTSGTTWFIDNILTSTSRLYVPVIAAGQLQLTPLGIGNRNGITFSYSTPDGGTYDLCLTDMMGRIVYKEQFVAGQTQTTHSIPALGLRDGMYFLKIDNGINYGVAKVMVQ